MPVISIALLVVGLALTALGCLTWRSIGKRMALIGMTQATYAAGLLLGNNVILMYLAWILLAALIIANIMTTTRASWRQIRIEVLLAAATIIAMGASYLVTDVSSVVQNALLVIVVMTAIAFIGSMVFHGIPLLVRETRQRISRLGSS
jgi:hypothetical protein